MEVLSFIGADNDILKLCSKKEQLLYRIFNYILLFLIVVVGLSIYYIVDVIFENTLASVILAVFWSFIFFNLYRFILFTVTGKRGANLKEKIGIVFPNIFKISVVIFFAIFISLPVELFVNRGFIEENLPDELSNKINTVKLEIDTIYLNKENELTSRLNKYSSELNILEINIRNQENKYKAEQIPLVKTKILNYIVKLKKELQLKTHKYVPIIAEHKKKISLLENEKKVELKQYVSIIKHSNLLIERFSLLFKKKPFREFFFTLFIIAVFLSPLVYKIYSLYRMGYKYEKFNNDRMRREIIANYEGFKQSFKKTTYFSTGQETNYLELYADAPFNTIKRVDKRKRETKGSFASFLIQNHEN